MDNKHILNLSRRQWLARTSAAAGGLVMAASRGFAAPDDGVSRDAEAIHQEIIFKAAPGRIYDVLTDARKFQKMESFSDAVKSLDITTHPAKISRKLGGAFSLFGDFVTGRQLELIPNQRIVQAWRSASWKSGSYSIAHFELREDGASTKLIFDHSGFPVGTAEHLAAGWYGNYWDPLQKYLASK